MSAIIAYALLIFGYITMNEEMLIASGLFAIASEISTLKRNGVNEHDG